VGRLDRSARNVARVNCFELDELGKGSRIKLAFRLVPLLAVLVKTYSAITWV
jgi:hypothetical protein